MLKFEKLNCETRGQNHANSIKVFDISVTLTIWLYSQTFLVLTPNYKSIMNLWPHGKDLSLLFTIGNYFQSLLSNENRSKIKSKHLLQISSLRANIKSLLRQLTDTQVIPQTSISLQDIYNEYIHDESPWPNSITKISNTSSGISLFLISEWFLSPLPIYL